jgi:hypothetical protein
MLQVLRLNAVPEVEILLKAKVIGSLHLNVWPPCHLKRGERIVPWR